MCVSIEKKSSKFEAVGSKLRSLRFWKDKTEEILQPLPLWQKIAIVAGATGITALGVSFYNWWYFDREISSIKKNFLKKTFFKQKIAKLEEQKISVAKPCAFVFLFFSPILLESVSRLNKENSCKKDT